MMGAEFCTVRLPAMVPNVVMAVDPAQVDKAVFSTADSPTSVFVTVSHAGAVPLVPSPVCLRNFLVVVLFGTSMEVALLPDCQNVAPTFTPLPSPMRFVAFDAVPVVSWFKVGIADEVQMVPFEVITLPFEPTATLLETVTLEEPSNEEPLIKTGDRSFVVVDELPKTEPVRSDIIPYVTNEPFEAESVVVPI